jgi:hypothetical protein
MYNIEYLTERDMKYFEKKEALGEAIIIRIEPEMLLSLDMDALFRDREKDQTLSAKELEDFLRGRGGPKDPDPEETDIISEDLPITGLEKNLQHISLTQDQRQSLLQMINSGISDEELMELLQGQGS